MRRTRSSMRLNDRVIAGLAFLIGMVSCRSDGIDPPLPPLPPVEVIDVAGVVIAPDTVELMAPGVARVRVTITNTKELIVPVGDTFAKSIQTSGPFTAGWQGDNKGIFRNVAITATAPGTGSLIVQASARQDTVVLKAAAPLFKRVSVSEGFACGIGQDDRAWCWGDNGSRQLGVVTPGVCSGGACQYNAGRYAATPIAVRSPHTFTQVTGGSVVCSPGLDEAYACGHSCALTPDDQPVCWGENYSAATTFSLPSKVASVVVTPSLSIIVRATNCALLDDGRAFCFGPGATDLSQIGTGLLFSALDVGRYHTCGVRTDGDIYCWGSNARGNLGVGTVDSDAHPNPVKAIAPEKFSSVEVGDYSTCGLAVSGKLYCWGQGYSSTGVSPPPTCPAVGSFPPLCQATPRVLEGGTTYVQFSRSQVSNRLCGLTGAGTVDCWAFYNTSPTSVTVPEPLTSVSVGGPNFDNRYFDAHGCGVSTTSRVWCWNATTVRRIGQ